MQSVVIFIIVVPFIASLVMDPTHVHLGLAGQGLIAHSDKLIVIRVILAVIFAVMLLLAMVLRL